MSTNTKVFIPQRMELPIFINKSIRMRINNERLMKHLNKNKNLYNCSTVQEKEIDTKVEEIIKKKLPTSNRDLVKYRPWSLPPNRYNIKETIRFPKGDKGSFWSTLRRVNGTIISHHPPTKPIGIQKFYNVNEQGVKKVCNKYKSKFLINLRKKKPTSRFMTTDLSICWRDPQFPGPDKYSPKIAKKPKRIPKSKIIMPRIYKFYPNSSVPITENSIYPNKLSEPGPGRYNPIKPSPCKCPHTKCLVNPDLFYDTEMNKIRKYRHIPRKKFQFSKYCEEARLRGIMGHGHQWLFRPDKNYKKPEPIQTSKEDPNRKMFMTMDYLHMIVNPKRKTMSLRAKKWDVGKPRIRFMSKSKPIIRRKLKENPNIVFMSGMPRWKKEESRKVPTTPKTTEKTKFKIPIYEDTLPPKELIESKLSDVPERHRPMQRSERIKYFTFSRIPPEKLLLTPDDVRNFGKSKFNYIIEKIIPEDLFRDDID